MALQLHYKMNDCAASTVVVDSSGNGFNGTLNENTNLHHRNTIMGGALYFAGKAAATNDYINSGQTFQTVLQGNWSVNFWVRLLDGIKTGEQSFFGLYDTSGNNIFQIFIYAGAGVDGKIIGYYKCNGVTADDIITDIPMLSDGLSNFIHIGFTFVKSTLAQIYINGQPVTTGGSDISTLNFDNWVQDNNLFIGTRPGIDGNPVNSYVGCLMRDFRLYNELLTDVNMWDLYQNGLALMKRNKKLR